MIQRLDLRQFKAFARYRATFGNQAFLVGPNKAGKSTLIAALRASTNMLRIARRLGADRRVQLDDQEIPAWSFTTDGISLVDENLRHEFRSAETRISIRFRGGARLVAVWPDENADDPEPFFAVFGPDEVRISRPAVVRSETPNVVVIPVLMPVEREEVVLDETYVRRN